MRETIRQLISSITPYDPGEKKDISEVIAWIDSDVEIFRIQKPDIPPKHLVSYFVLIDRAKKKLLLIDHIKAKKWLPTGGHIEKDEHPKTTVEREIVEEINLTAEFILPTPFFIDQTKTVNTDAGHTDVNLWYLLKGDSSSPIVYDEREMNGYQWVDFEEIAQTDSNKLQDNLHRFMKKLSMLLLY